MPDLFSQPRRGGNTDAMLKWLVEGAAEAGEAMAVVQRRDLVVRPCSGCERCRRDKRCTGQIDAMQILYPLIEAAEGLVPMTTERLLLPGPAAGQWYTDPIKQRRKQ